MAAAIAGSITIVVLARRLITQALGAGALTADILSGSVPIADLIRRFESKKKEEP